MAKVNDREHTLGLQKQQQRASAQQDYHRSIAVVRQERLELARCSGSLHSVCPPNLLSITGMPIVMRLKGGHAASIFVWAVTGVGQALLCAARPLPAVMELAA